VVFSFSDQTAGGLLQAETVTAGGRGQGHRPSGSQSCDAPVLVTTIHSMPLRLCGTSSTMRWIIEWPSYGGA